MVGKKTFKRRKIFIDPLFQYRFVKNMTAMALLVTFSATASMLLVLSLLKREISQPDPFSPQNAVSLESMPDISWMLTHLWPYFLLALALVAIISMVFGVIESFRIAGPVYRMRQVLKAIRRGDFSEGSIPLRKHDELEKLYKGIVGVHTKWRSNVQTLQNICDQDDAADVQLAKLRVIIFSFKTGVSH